MYLKFFASACPVFLCEVSYPSPNIASQTSGVSQVGMMHRLFWECGVYSSSLPHCFKITITYSSPYEHFLWGKHLLRAPQDTGPLQLQAWDPQHPLARIICGLKISHRQLQPGPWWIRNSGEIEKITHLGIWRPATHLSFVSAGKMPRWGNDCCHEGDFNLTWALHHFNLKLLPHHWARRTRTKGKAGQWAWLGFL